MITLYTFPTPNSWRASIALEELGLEYSLRFLDLPKGEHLTAEYRAISPIAKIPAMVDDGETVFGSMAILLHLAEKHGRLMPAERKARTQAHNWLAFAASDLAPSLVSAYYFQVRAAEPQPLAIQYFEGEGERCRQALESRLAVSEYVAGDEYSIADIACFPFMAMGVLRVPTFRERWPHIGRWHDQLAARPAVAKGMITPPMA